VARLMVIYSCTICRCVEVGQAKNLMPADRENRERWMKSDPKRVVSDWNREIEAEIRRGARREDGPWGVVVWVALAMVWFGVLVAAIGLFERLQR